MIWSSFCRKSLRFFFSPKCPDFLCFDFYDVCLYCCLRLDRNFSYTVKAGFYIPWISMCLDSVHIFVTPTKMSVRIFPWNIYIHPYVQIEHERSCSYHIHYFQLKMRKEKLVFIYSFLSSCMPTIKWIQDCASTVESCFLQMLRLYKDEWCLMHVLIDH
jgi:hypothetical protein